MSKSNKRNTSAAKRAVTVDNEVTGARAAEKSLAEREKELEKREKELEKREQELEYKIVNAQPDIEKAEQAKNEAATKKKEADVLFAKAEGLIKEITKRDNDISNREAVIRAAEIGKQENLEEMRRKAEIEILDKRQKALEDIEKKNAEVHEKNESLLNDTLEQCVKLRSDTAREMSDLRDKELNEYIRELNEHRQKNAEELQNILTNKENLDKQQEDLNFEKECIRMREQQLDDRRKKYDFEIEERAKQRSSEIESEKEALEAECNLLREAIMKQKAELEAFATFKATLGDDPTVLRKQIADYKNKIQELNDRIANAPSPEYINECEQYKARYSNLEEKNNELNIQCTQYMAALAQEEHLLGEIAVLNAKNTELNRMITESRLTIESLHNEIKRLCTAEAQAAERNDRLLGLFDLRPTQLPFNDNLEQPCDEIEWLDGISKKSDEVDMVFPKRILYAFHTALKIADWSTITVLAGVSGTGKSELPRLYSEFGGINFINVPVQPNWDSQESMLGYFNSIDQKFDAQPLLRFLVKCTEVFDKNDEDMMKLRELLGEEFTPLNEDMSIVLLDEMNLAHVEHYFADFLSKLESRRGKARKYVPTIEVKLGAGFKPYDLRLSRNVLWAGTMNQDETTKSLSDKVLDRGIVINFPRPKKLKERHKLASIDKAKVGKNDDKSAVTANIPPLKKTTWDKWLVTEIQFKGEQLEELMRFKGIVEEINDCLAFVGRAIGHRVWQSIEFYIANYPDVIKEMKDNDAKSGKLTEDLKKSMHIAFEDQIVQKIMPKLRGIETRGPSRRECLDRIKSLLESEKFNLSEDFDIACRLGYGQFIWCSANYIDADET